MESNMYKLFLLCVILSCITSITAQPANFSTILSTCETQFNNNLLTWLLNGASATTWPNPVRCLCACVGKGIYLMDSSTNKLNTTYISTISDTNLKNAFTSCTSITVDSNECIAAGQIIKCLRKNGPTYGVWFPIIQLLYWS